jgi:hypothetical protein
LFRPLRASPDDKPIHIRRFCDVVRDRGWPENEPHILVLSLTTQKGVQDFAFNKEDALLIAKTIKDTAVRLAKPKTG